MWAMSSTLSSQSGSDDLPKPGCDGAITRRSFASKLEKRQVEADAAAAVQIEDRRALPALEHVKLDTRDRDHRRGFSLRAPALLLVMTAASALIPRRAAKALSALVIGPHAI